MTKYKDVGVVLLHGLPEGGRNGSPAPDPFDQLTQVHTVLEGLVPDENIFEYYWIRDLPAAPSLVARGRLGERGAECLITRLRDDYFSKTEIRRWIIGGFSGGGWIIHQWLHDSVQSSDAKEDLDNVIFVFTIGAPYQNVYDLLKIGEPQELYRVRKWELDPNVIAQALPRCRFYAIWSRDDETIRSENAEFPEPLVDDGLVHGLPLTDVSHNALCASEIAIDFIRESLTSALARIES